jgi:hypothetical protein
MCIIVVRGDPRCKRAARPILAQYGATIGGAAYRRFEQPSERRDGLIDRRLRDDGVAIDELAQWRGRGRREQAVDVPRQLVVERALDAAEVAGADRLQEPVERRHGLAFEHEADGLRGEATTLQLERPRHLLGGFLRLREDRRFPAQYDARCERGPAVGLCGQHRERVARLGECEERSHAGRRAERADQVQPFERHGRLRGVIEPDSKVVGACDHRLVVGLVGDAVAALPGLLRCGQCAGERLAVEVAPRRRLLTQHAAVDRQLPESRPAGDLRPREEVQHLADFARTLGGDALDRKLFGEALRRLEDDPQ